MEKYTKFTATTGKGVFHRSIDISQISEYDQYLLSPEILELLERVKIYAH